MNIALDVSF